MNNFQRCAGAICKAVLGCAEPAYLEQLEQLNDAVCEWHEGRLATAEPVELRIPTLDGPVLITGNLDLADTLGICQNDAAREMIAWVDEKTGHTATLLMLQICCAIQDAHRRAASN